MAATTLFFALVVRPERAPIMETSSLMAAWMDVLTVVVRLARLPIFTSVAMLAFVTDPAGGAVWGDRELISSAVAVILVRTPELFGR